jgi:hypothetical protein
VIYRTKGVTFDNSGFGPVQFFRPIVASSIARVGSAQPKAKPMEELKKSPPPIR